MREKLPKGLSPADLLACEEVTQEIPVASVTFMAKSWPVETFIQHLRQLMDREGVADYAELSRLSGVSQTQFSNWRKGTHQPSQESLDRIAPVLHTTQSSLYIAAGLLSPDHLGAPDDYKPTVLPREILDLIALYESMTTDAGRRYIREHIDFALRGLKASAPEPEQTQPRPRRRAS